MSTNREMVKDFLQRHPLQRLESPSRSLSALLHVSGLASFAYSFNYLVAHPNPINDSYGWHMQYLTIIGLSTASLTFIVGLLADMTLSARLFSYKNALSVASAPMEILISLLYWGLKTFDERLVLPDWAPRLSLTDDFSFHAIPALALAIDLLFFSPPYSVSAIPAFGLSSVIAVGYWFWIEQCFQHNGFYPYPIFEVLDLYGRIGLFAGSAIVMSVSTLTLKWLYSTVNGREQDRKHCPSQP